MVMYMCVSATSNHGYDANSKEDDACIPADALGAPSRAFFPSVACASSDSGGVFVSPSAAVMAGSGNAGCEFVSSSAGMADSASSLDAYAGGEFVSAGSGMASSFSSVGANAGGAFVSSGACMVGSVGSVGAYGSTSSGSYITSGLNRTLVSVSRGVQLTFLP